MYVNVYGCVHVYVHDQDARLHVCVRDHDSDILLNAYVHDYNDVPSRVHVYANIPYHGRDCHVPESH